MPGQVSQRPFLIQDAGVLILFARIACNPGRNIKRAISADRKLKAENANNRPTRPIREKMIAYRQALRYFRLSASFYVPKHESTSTDFIVYLLKSSFIITSIARTLARNGLDTLKGIHPVSLVKTQIRSPATYVNPL